MSNWRVAAAEVLYSGRLLRLELLRLAEPSGQIHEREVVRHPGAVAIVSLLGERVLLVRQYRAPVGKELWELPAGTLEPGESPLECAKRELEEETGYLAREWRKLAEFYTTPGFCDERMVLFLAKGLEPAAGRKPAEDESIELREFTLAEVERLLRRGELEDAKTIVGLLLLISPHGLSTATVPDIRILTTL
ncbi:MAG: NUDIX hydrolase [Candidatus Acetothermia bacterium]|jgi:ADP-ribose pyrophosphatase|nr:NUDIX hydrolase [Candidatus Acetothermia bacterium]MDH7505915.1 NUDIX hydrolase [Candidatus Acetothermia bacterium]